MFSEPSSTATGPKAEEFVGHLIIVKPTEYKTGITTSFGKRDAIQVEIDDVETGDSHTCLFFQGFLVGSFKGSIGEQLLGTIVRGQAKPGQSAPFLFESKTSDTAAVARATEFLTKKTAGSFSAPKDEPAAAPAGGVDLSKLSPEQIAAVLAAQSAA